MCLCLCVVDGLYGMRKGDNVVNKYISYWCGKGDDFGIVVD